MTVITWCSSPDDRLGTISTISIDPGSPRRALSSSAVFLFFFFSGWILRMSNHIVVMIQHGCDRHIRRHLFVVPDGETMLLGCDIEDKGGGFGLAHCSNLG